MGRVARQPRDRRVVQGRGRNSSSAPITSRSTPPPASSATASRSDLYNYECAANEGYQQRPHRLGLARVRGLPQPAVLRAALPAHRRAARSTRASLIWTAIGFALLALSIVPAEAAAAARARSCGRSRSTRCSRRSASGRTRSSASRSSRACTGSCASDRRSRRAGRGVALVQAAAVARPVRLVGVSPATLLTHAGSACSSPAWCLAAVSWGALPEASQAFVGFASGNVGSRGERMWNKHTPRAFFELLAPGPVPRGSLLGGLRARVVCSRPAIVVAWRVKQRTGAPVAVMFPVAVFLSLWASPHALIYEWALLFRGGRGALGTIPGIARCVALPLCARLGGAGGRARRFRSCRRSSGDFRSVVQFSVPVMALVGWLGARELMLARSAEAQS